MNGDRLNAVEKAVEHHPDPVVSARDVAETLLEESDVYDDVGDPRREALGDLRLLEKGGFVRSKEIGARAIAWWHRDRVVAAPPEHPDEHPDRAELDEDVIETIESFGDILMLDDEVVEGLLSDVDEALSMDGFVNLDEVGGLDVPARHAERADHAGDPTPHAGGDRDVDDVLLEESDDVQEAIERVRVLLEDRPPETSHGKNAVLSLYALLLEESPRSTGALKSELFERHSEHYNSKKSLWESIARYFDDLPGIEKAGYGQWRLDVDAIYSES